MSFELSPDYNTVAARIAEFREKYPTGCLRPADPRRPYSIETIGDQSYVVVVTAAYRDPADSCPGIGTAWEVVPGRTPYTRGSEIMNAETSSWGRALIAVGAADAKKGIASAEEVAGRAPERQRRSPRPKADEDVVEPIRPQQRTAIMAGFGELGYGGDANRDARLQVAARLAGLEVLASTNDLTATQARMVLDGLTERKRAQRKEKTNG